MALRWDAVQRGWEDEGRLLRPLQIRRLRDDLASEVARQIRIETDLMLSGKVEIDAWANNVERMLLRGQGSGYAFGRGGIAQMTDGDYDRLARLLDEQSGFFGQFKAEIEAGNLSDAQIAARAEMYAGSTINAYEQGQHQAAIGDSEADWDLPVYPADGGTTCLSRCRCAWQIDEDAYGWTCVWETEGDEQVCPECEERGRMYGAANPLTFAKPYGEQVQEAA